ncbi:class I SAM-dependent methyltransferase [Actinopolymorpha sp. B9G3]|uniref:class I SAM-dependent methyltransferase n=1 Tax=Actinopolymorpha sp. B9G3 TaxID=3158970 RepID=UPI0032D962A3
MAEPIAETQETYDAIASEYLRRNSTVDSRSLNDDIAALAAVLPPGSWVADVGCGPGREVRAMRANGFRVVGLDLSAGQLRTGGLTGAARADMRQLPLRTGSMDAVWCQAALLHLPRADVPGVLAEFARAVRIGGRLHLSVADGDGEAWEVAFNYGSHRRRWFTYHRAPDLAAHLAAAGFVVQEVRRTTSFRDWLGIDARRVAT